MKTILKIVIFAALILCSTAVYADNERTQQLRQNIENALAAGDCARAQQNYDLWRSEAFANRRDAEIERRITECINRANQPVVQPPVPQPTVAITSTTDPGVVINGVRWATRNVDAPGTFAATPESWGMFFQFNRRQGWPLQEASNWNRRRERAASWAHTNDPCPQGWRVPTSTEFQNLINAGSTWTTRNGVNGRLFGVAPNQIFLPAAGDLGFFGRPGLLNYRGSYWSSSTGGSHEAGRYLSIHRTDVRILSSHGNTIVGQSIRCVAR